MTDPSEKSTPKLRRLKVRAEFLRAAKGQRAARPGVLVQCIDRPDFNDLGAGFTASRKVGNSVVRNRARRRLKEAVRLLLPLLGIAGRDYVFVARQATAEREWTLLLEDVRSALTSLARPSNGAPNSAPGRPRPGSAPAI
ncbi:MAG: ribonuclease P protein component [Caulobacterales bacterium]